MSNAFEITKVDKNMITETGIKDEGVVFLSVREAPFKLYGLYNPKEGPFRRLPEEVAEATNPGVKGLNFHTAGARVRFTTDSPYIGLRVYMNSLHLMSHMAPSGSSGFDVYVDDEFYAVCRPPINDLSIKEYESVVRFPDRKMRNITINFPLYNDVKDLLVALDGEAKVTEAPDYRLPKPVVFYGSSITQGGCASRPGNVYTSIVCRHLNLDHINLGFSGSGRGEDVIVDYMASLDMCIFVSDYDHNAPNVEHLKKTHYRMYEKIRAKHPEIPYIMISKPDVLGKRIDASKRRFVIEESYRRAIENGDERVYYIDGEGFFRGPWEDACTVDMSHPNDLGFMLMADKVERVLVRALHDMETV